MIPLTNLHKFRVADQVRSNIFGLQRDMIQNAKTHKTMALAQSPDVVTLAGLLTSCAIEYIRRFQWLIDLRNDPVRKQRLLDVFALMGWTETDVTDVATPLRQAAVTLRDASKLNYTEIIAACDALLSTVDVPDSLWPE